MTVRNKKAKLEDIARKCNVSISSVSRALNNEPGISSETRKTVLRAAEELNFTPAKRKRPLTRSRLNLLVVVPEKEELSVNPFLNITELISSINDAFRDEKKRVEVISITDFENYIKESLPAIDGVLLAYRGIEENLRAVLRENGTPYVFLSRFIPDENYVSCNYYKGIIQLANMLIETGHERIGYFGNAGNPNNIDRFRGYRTALTEADMYYSPELVLMAESYNDIGRMSADFFYGNKADAVICFNDYMAIRLTGELEKAGIHVPGNISITGFDNSPLRNIFSPAIATIAQPAFEMGFLASRWLRDNILNRSNRDLRIEVDGKLLHGESVQKREQGKSHAL